MTSSLIITYTRRRNCYDEIQLCAYCTSACASLYVELQIIIDGIASCGNMAFKFAMKLSGIRERM